MTEPKLAPITVSGSFAKMGESLKLLRDYAVSAAEQAGLSKQRITGLMMAVDEYATNIITYGYRDAGLSGDIYASAELDSGYLIISLIDEAAPFDPTTHADPTNLDVPLEERDIGGLGIMLVRENTDDWRYERVDGKNYNHFFLKLE